MKDNIASEPLTGAVRGRRRGLWLFPLAAVGLVLYLGFSFVQRWEAEKRLAEWTRERAVPTVSVISPHRDDKPQILALPGNIAAWNEASIHAQVAGYVRSWRTDIGAIVKKGDLLAEVDTPELDERLAQAREELSRAEAGRALAGVTAERWSALRSSAAVSKQSADEKTSDLKVKQADVGAASANLDRLKAQKQFAQIVAPFDGVVTARNIDIGSYVGPNGAAQPLFKVADVHAVRVYVNVPQIYAARLTAGMRATFTTPQWPGRKFDARVATTSNAIGAQSGSLLLELDAANADGALFPGSYAEVHFELATDPSQLRVVSSALSVGQHGVRVATVDAEGRVKFKTVVIARDFGVDVAIASGLEPQDRIINNPPESLADGDKVRISGEPSTGAAE
jgi:RND family efflux transporter MFP subunit